MYTYCVYSLLPSITVHIRYLITALCYSLRNRKQTTKKEKERKLVTVFFFYAFFPNKAPTFLGHIFSCSLLPSLLTRKKSHILDNHVEKSIKKNRNKCVE